MGQGENAGDPMELVRAKAGEILAVGDPVHRVLMRVLAPTADRRAQEVAKDLQQAIAFLVERGRDVDDLASDEAFCDLVFAATGSALRNHASEKRTALRNAIMNAGLPTAPIAVKQHIFLRFVDEFSELHLRLLDFVDGPERWFQCRGRKAPDHWLTSTECIFAVAYPELAEQKSLCRIVADDLHKRGLITSGDITVVVRGPSAKGPSTTLLGAEFVGFIREPQQPKART